MLGSCRKTNALFMTAMLVARYFQRIPRRDDTPEVYLSFRYIWMQITTVRCCAARWITVSPTKKQRCTSPMPVIKSTRKTPNGNLRSEEHTSELQSRENLVCRLLLEKKKTRINTDKQYSNKEAGADKEEDIITSESDKLEDKRMVGTWCDQIRVV